MRLMATAGHPIAVRIADHNDAELLARLGAETFAQAFAAANTPEDMATYLAASFSPALQAAELQHPRASFLIAEAAGRPAGYAKLEVSDPPPCVSALRPVELVRFYVDAAWHGQGVSHSLMNEALSFAANAGNDVMWLGVWQQNARAIAFYRKWDFAIVGDKTFLLGTDQQTDFVMSRTVIGNRAGEVER
jgi:ribosomal protein S18 acetylase RimI-like enzyme